jgi:hypothetical protein
LFSNADAPNYWLCAPDAYRAPKYSGVRLKWRDVKISDLPKECIEQMRTEIKSPKIAEIDLNSDGVNELVINARPGAKIAGEYYIFMEKAPPYSSSAPKQYCRLNYEGICGDPPVILEPENGFYQFLVTSRSGMRYKFFKIYSVLQGGPSYNYIMTRSETHDFRKYQVKIERGRLWGDYPDEVFTAALERCLRTVIDKHYSDKVSQEDLKISKREIGTDFICRKGKEVLISLVYGKPDLKLRCPNMEFAISSRRSLYYCYSPGKENTAILEAIKQFLKNYKYIPFADRLADEINRYYATKNYLAVTSRFEYFLKHYPSNKKLPKLLFKTVDAAIENNKKSDSAWGKYWKAVNHLYRAFKYLDGDDRAEALYRMWNIQYAIRTPESWRLAESYRRKINREHPNWKWSQPLFTVPPRSSKLYNPKLTARRKIGESATFERFKFDYAPGKSAEFLVISIPFSKESDYLTALGKAAFLKDGAQTASIFSAALTISFSPREVSLPAPWNDKAYFGWGFYGLPMPPLSYGGGFPRYYLGAGLSPDKNLFFFILDPAESPKELPSFNEFQNMLRRDYPLEGLIFFMWSGRFSGQVEEGFIDLARRLILGRDNRVLPTGGKTP